MDREEIGKLVVNVKLPFGIPIVPGRYKVHFASKDYIFYIRRYDEDKSGWQVSGTGSVETPFDKWGRDYKSDIAIIFPERVFSDEYWGDKKHDVKTSPIFDGELFKDSRLEKAVQVINRVIEVCRHFSRRYHLSTISYIDILDYDFWVEKDGKFLKDPKIKTIFKGPIKITAGNSDYEKVHQKIINALENGEQIDICQNLLLRAKEFFINESYPFALLESVIALEITMSNFIRLKTTRIGIKEERVDEFIKGVSCKDRIDIVLKMLTEGLPQIDENVLGKCKGAITLRNKVVHDGLGGISEKEAEDSILNIEKFIGYIKEITG